MVPTVMRIENFDWFVCFQIVCLCKDLLSVETMEFENEKPAINLYNCLVKFISDK